MAVMQVVGVILAALGIFAGMVIVRTIRDPKRPVLIHVANMLLWLPMKLKVGPFKHSLTIAGWLVFLQYSFYLKSHNYCCWQALVRQHARREKLT